MTKKLRVIGASPKRWRHMAKKWTWSKWAFLPLNAMILHTVSYWAERAPDCSNKNEQLPPQKWQHLQVFTICLNIYWLFDYSQVAMIEKYFLDYFKRLVVICDVLATCSYLPSNVQYVVWVVIWEFCVDNYLFMFIISLVCRYPHEKSHSRNIPDFCLPHTGWCWKSFCYWDGNFSNVVDKF